LAPRLSFVQLRRLFVQTEQTPNTDALKFIPGRTVLQDTTAEFLDRSSAYTSPLAASLFKIQGIKHVFLGPTFVTVTKDPDTEWPILKPDIFAAIMDFFTSGKAIMDVEAPPLDTTVLPGDSEHVVKIKELIETRVRPSIQDDGGDIEYCGYEEGIVKLKLKGACRTCDSSVVTLKTGIEAMLKYYIPQVKAVEHVLDGEENISREEFARFEHKLSKKESA